MDDFRQLGPKDAAPSVYKRASALMTKSIDDQHDQSTYGVQRTLARVQCLAPFGTQWQLIQLWTLRLTFDRRKRVLLFSFLCYTVGRARGRFERQLGLRPRTKVN